MKEYIEANTEKVAVPRGSFVGVGNGFIKGISEKLFLLKGNRALWHHKAGYFFKKLSYSEASKEDNTICVGPINSAACIRKNQFMPVKALITGGYQRKMVFLDVGSENFGHPEDENQEFFLKSLQNR